MIIPSLVIITGGMMHARAILIPLMMASFISIVSSGPISWFMEKGCPQSRFMGKGLGLSPLVCFFRCSSGAGSLGRSGCFYL